MDILLLRTLPRKWLSSRSEERVVILLGEVGADSTYTVRRAVPIPNRAADRATRFAVHRSDLHALVGSMADSVIGVIHSHIDGDKEPSDADLESIPEDWIGAVWAGGSLGRWYGKGRLLPHARVRYRVEETSGPG